MTLIALAGVGAGAINAVVGSGTLITFPTLVTLGYPPVTSTMSNAIGLVAGSTSGTWGYRRELRGQWHRLRWQVMASLTGAVLGSWLLLHLPEKVFTQVVPVLLVIALILVVTAPRIQEWARRRGSRSSARSCATGPDGGTRRSHLRRRRVRRLLHRRAGHPADGGDGRTAAGGRAAHECGEEPTSTGSECRRRGGLHRVGVRQDQLVGSRTHRGRLARRWFPRCALWSP